MADHGIQKREEKLNARRTGLSIAAPMPTCMTDIDDTMTARARRLKKVRLIFDSGNQHLLGR